MHSEKPKQEEQQLIEKFLQVVVAGGAVNRYYDKSLFGRKIRRVLVVVALPEIEAQVFEGDRTQVIHYWNQWQQRLNLFGANHQLTS